MNTLIRATLTASLALPLALPAAAATPRPAAPAPLGSHQHRATPRPSLGPKDVFLMLHARHRAPVSHFSFPYAVATDKSGNLFVANTDSNSVVEVSSALKVLPKTITQGLSTPISIAVDTNNDVYVGNIAGNVTEYSTGFALTRTITANASNPVGIAVDQFQDLFVLTPAGLAVDDPYGASLFTDIYSGQLYSVAIGGSTVYAFFNDTWAQGNGSVALRSGALQSLIGPTGSTYPVGSACASNGFCWYGDSGNNTLALGNGSVTTITLSYSPAGVAYDPTHNRLFVADPNNNKIEVYNATTLAFERSIN